MKDTSDKARAPRLASLITLITEMQSTSPEQRRKQYLKGKHERNATDFTASLDYLDMLGLLEITRDDIVKPVGELDSLVNNSLEVDKDTIKDLLVRRMLSGDSSSVFLHEFLSLFHWGNGAVHLRTALEDRLRYSDLRNLFLELGILEYIELTDSYKVTPPFADKFRPIAEDAEYLTIDENELLIQLERQRRLGLDAELLVIQHEYSRLAKMPDLLEKIRHVAKINVGAGYDILSWESDGSKRYIEVKAVSPTDMKFYWSSNEVRVASELGAQYFLYLLPVISGKIGTDAMQIIKDPYERVFLNKRDWTRTSQVYTMWKSKEDGTNNG